MVRKVFISAFGDEGPLTRNIREQLCTISAMGLNLYSLRNVDLGIGRGIQHVSKLSDFDLGLLGEYNTEFGCNVVEVGSAIGKSKLLDEEDGSKNKYFTPAESLLQMERHSVICHKLDAKVIRGFPFYHPRGKPAKNYIGASVERLGPLADLARKKDLTLALEIEVHLVGEDGESLAEIQRQLGNENVVLVFDGANLACRNIGPEGCLEHFMPMLPSLGYLHAKDYKIQADLAWTGEVDEAHLKHFVPVGEGDSGYPLVLKVVLEHFDELEARAKKLGLPGVMITLEPHMKGGGQFGGFSGPDGMGVALRALLRVLDSVGLGYHLLDTGAIQTRRGF